MHAMGRLRRAGKIGGVLVAAVMGLTACGSGPSGTGGVETITFWDDNGGVRTPLYNHLIPEFEAQNPGIRVDYVGLPISSVQQKYDTAIAGGAAPDVGGINTTVIGDLVAQNALVPLDSELASSPLAGKLGSSFLNAYRAAAPDHKLYAIPTTDVAEVLWYRNDLFSQAGLTPPATWNEFFADAHTLTHGGIYGYTIRGGSGSIPPLLGEMYAYSGLTSFFDKSGKTTVNNPKNVEFVTRLAQLYKTATPAADLNNSYTQMVAEFDSGSVAMLQHNLGSYSENVKALPGKVMAAPLPQNNPSRPVILAQAVDGFGVFKSSRHQAAAWKFIEFLASKDADSYWNQNVGQIPTNTEVATESWVQQEQPVRDSLALLKNPSVVSVALPYYLPQWSSITQTDMEPLFQRVLLKQMSAKDFLDRFADEINTAQAEWQKRHPS